MQGLEDRDINPVPAQPVLPQPVLIEAEIIALRERIAENIVSDPDLRNVSDAAFREAMWITIESVRPGSTREEMQHFIDELVAARVRQPDYVATRADSGEGGSVPVEQSSESNNRAEAAEAKTIGEREIKPLPKRISSNPLLELETINGSVWTIPDDTSTVNQSATPSEHPVTVAEGSPITAHRSTGDGHLRQRKNLFRPDRVVADEDEAASDRIIFGKPVAGPSTFKPNLERTRSKSPSQVSMLASQERQRQILFGADSPTRSSSDEESTTSGTTAGAELSIGPSRKTTTTNEDKIGTRPEPMRRPPRFLFGPTLEPDFYGEGSSNNKKPTPSPPVRRASSREHESLFRPALAVRVPSGYTGSESKINHGIQTDSAVRESDPLGKGKVSEFEHPTKTLPYEDVPEITIDTHRRWDVTDSRFGIQSRLTDGSENNLATAGPVTTDGQVAVASQTDTSVHNEETDDLVVNEVDNDEDDGLVVMEPGLDLPIDEIPAAGEVADELGMEDIEGILEAVGMRGKSVLCGIYYIRLSS